MTTNAEFRDLAETWGWLRIGQQQSIAEIEAWLEQYPAVDHGTGDKPLAESSKKLRQGEGS